MPGLTALSRLSIALFPIVLVATSAHAQFPIDRTLATKPGERIFLDIDAGGAVDVRGTDGNQVRVRVDEGSRECEPRCQVDIEPDGEGVHVRAYHVERSSRNRGSLRFTVEVPRRYDVRIETTGGGVTVEGVTGRISGRTMGGGLRFSNLDGTLDFTTMGGAISVRDSKLDGRVHSMGGAVTIDGVSGNLSGTTMGGRVTRRGPSVSDASASGGRSSVRSGGVIHMRSMGGGISIDDAPEGADIETMGGDVRVRRAGGSVRAHTMGGTIRLGSVDGGIRATTMGGDVIVQMVGDASRGDRDVEISSMKGDIEVTVPKSLAMDIDVELSYTRRYEGDFRITSDVPLTQSVSSEWTDNGDTPRKTIRAKGSVGGGRNKVRIRTINGNVRIIRE